MAEARNFLKELSGKVGQLVFAKSKSGKTVVYLASDKKDTVRTKSQMMIRCVWSNLGALYTMFNQTLKRGHEGLTGGMSDYNAFIQDNTKLVKVYLSKTERLNGGCVLAPVLITRGKLPSIDYQPNEGGVMVTDVQLGELVVTGETTVAAFSMAVLLGSDDWEEGDQLTFFYGTQKVDSVTGTPRAKIKGFKVKLDTEDETPLWTVVSALGFSSVQSGNGYVLGMNAAITDGACAWIHSREDEAGELRVSTQRMVVDSSVLTSYMGEAAFDASVASYGGLTGSKKVYLRPDEETNLTGVVNTGGSGSGQSQGSEGSSTGSSTGSETGGDTPSGGGDTTPGEGD